MPIQSDIEHERFYHRDLSDMPAERAWAESVLLTNWLAGAIYAQARPRHLFDEVMDQDWARTRIQRLRTVMSGRRAAA